MNIFRLPKSPGVYIMKDAAGQVIYVGKAKDLKSRVRQYFSGHDERPQIKFLMLRVTEIETHVTKNEAEALLLENALIKKHRPRYNLFLKDDKTYQLLKLDLSHEFPALVITRKIKDDGALYFGPFISSAGLHEVVEFIESHFKLRTCSNAEFARRKRPCMEFQIKRCTAPCVGKISREDYARNIANVRLFLEGRKKELQHEIKHRMWEASQREDFETAAWLRDLLQQMAGLMETQKYARQDLPVAGVALLEHQIVGARHAVPKKLRAQHAVPLRELQKSLQLSQLPRRVECYDISNISGQQAVGSMVVFENGRAKKTDYRKFKIRSVQGANDTAMMFEVLLRRFGKNHWTKPDLIMVDGGRGQLSIALDVLKDLGVVGIDVIALAKQHEEIFIVGRRSPILLERSSNELQLLQRIRDEAHRFAITYHRSLREKELVTSQLDNIEGIGPVLKRRLIKYFGSVEAVLKAPTDELLTVRGVTDLLIRNIMKNKV